MYNRNVQHQNRLFFPDPKSHRQKIEGKKAKKNQERNTPTNANRGLRMENKIINVKSYT